MQIPRVHRFLSILEFFLYKIGSMALKFIYLCKKYAIQTTSAGGQK